MAKQPIQSQEQYQDLHFPKAGVSLAAAFDKQPVSEVLQGQYAKSTPVGNNVRAFEATSQRSRGGNRPGLVRYIPQPVVAGWIIQSVDIVVWNAGAVPP